MMKSSWKRYFFEFLSVFIGVTMAFALNKWNDDRKDNRSTEKILMEIRNGLELDLQDLKINQYGHNIGIHACDYFHQLINNQAVATDSIANQYRSLLRDYVSIQDRSGYESLKSKGLEFIHNDSLRLKIITLYDFDYEVIEKLEENYSEMQFNENYFMPINDLIADNFVFDEHGEFVNIKRPFQLSKIEKNKLSMYLWRIKSNRNFMKKTYVDTEKKVTELIELIDKEIK